VKRCIVVGASGTLGRAVVKELAARDARVGGTYRSNTALGIPVRRLDLLSVDTIEPVIADLAR
jgi:NAD(P)-dependent dehydrogenase (short-subunit alcohol dehydrogenase family)